MFRAMERVKGRGAQSGDVSTRFGLATREVDGDWRDIAAPKGSPVANGVTDVRWPALRTARIRVAFTQHPGKAVRLAEFKLFED